MSSCTALYCGISGPNDGARYNANFMAVAGKKGGIGVWRSKKYNWYQVNKNNKIINIYYPVRTTGKLENRWDALAMFYVNSSFLSHSA